MQLYSLRSTCTFSGVRGGKASVFPRLLALFDKVPVGLLRFSTSVPQIEVAASFVKTLSTVFLDKSLHFL